MANGSRDLVGKAARFVADDGLKYTFGAFMGAFRPNAQSANPAFTFFLFQTEAYRTHIATLLAGSSINNLRPTSVEALATRIPVDIAEQTAIAASLSDMDAEIAALEQKLAKARSLKQGMMQELLTGRIRLYEHHRPARARHAEPRHRPVPQRTWLSLPGRLDRPRQQQYRADPALRLAAPSRGHTQEQIAAALYRLRTEADNHDRTLYGNNQAVYALLRYGVQVKTEAGKATETVR